VENFSAVLVLLHAVSWADKHDENTGHIFATFVANAHYFTPVISLSAPYGLCIIADKHLSVVNQVSQA